MEKVFLEISQNSQENPCVGLRPGTLLKKRLWHRCFPVNFAKFLKAPFIIERLWWLHSPSGVNQILKKNYIPIIFGMTPVARQIPSNRLLKISLRSNMPPIKIEKIIIRVIIIRVKK